MQYLWSLFDKKSRSYAGILPTSSFVEGIRTADQIFTDTKYDYHKYSLDYEFMYFGCFDDQTGHLLPATTTIAYTSCQIFGLLECGDIEMYDPLSAYYDSGLAIPYVLTKDGDK